MCSDAPDYGPLADASAEAAETMAGLGREQLAFNREQFNTYSPALLQLAESQNAAAAQQLQQGADYYDYNVSTFRPLEQGLVRDAQNFNTQAYRNQLADQAAADAGRAFGLSREASERAMRSMGVNPNSGAGQAMGQQDRLTQAAQRAGLMNNTRQQAEQMAWARQMDAAGLGRGLPGASTAAYAGATNSANSAGGLMTTPTNTFNAGFNSGAGTIGQGLNTQVSGLGTVLNAQASYAGQQAAGMGQLAGTAAGLYLASDRRLKENIVKVGEQNGFNIYEFNYKGTPERRFRGVMADEVESKMPDAVVRDEDGYYGVDYAMIGIDFLEVA